MSFNFTNDNDIDAAMREWESRKLGAIGSSTFDSDDDSIMTIQVQYYYDFTKYYYGSVEYDSCVNEQLTKMLREAELHIKSEASKFGCSCSCLFPNYENYDQWYINNAICIYTYNLLNMNYSTNDETAIEKRNSAYQEAFNYLMLNNVLVQ